jgi:hypothetical protein
LLVRSLAARSVVQHVFWPFFVAMVATLVLSTHPALADTREDAEAALRQADRDDEAYRFASAFEHYNEALVLDPASPRAPRAYARAAILSTHAEGDFAPFAALERMRRTPSLSNDPASVDRLVHEAETFPSGPVRVEVWVLAAEAYAHRFGRPRDAERLLAKVLADEKADRVIVSKAARDLVTLRLARGDLRGAQEAADLAGHRADPLLRRDVRRFARRHYLHIASTAVLVVMLLLAAHRCFVATRAGTSGGARIRKALAVTWKVVLGYAAYVAIGGALLASGYEAGTSKPFLYFGAVLVPIVLVARAWGAVGADALLARVGRAMLCGAAAMGAALLVLERVDATFLDGMGL